MKKTKITMLTLVVFASIGAAFAANNPFVAGVRYKVDSSWNPISIAPPSAFCIQPSSIPCTEEFNTVNGVLVPVTPSTRVTGIYQ